MLVKYGIDDRPAPVAMILYGLQWWVISLPCVVILGVVVGRLHFSEVSDQVFYLQKLFGLMGLAAIIQTFLGHRLPLVVGPAAILLVGLTASQASGLPALYTAMAVGGGVLALTALSGLLTRVRAFFTPRIVVVILVLIAFTLTPTILNLTFTGVDQPARHLGFVLALTLAMIMANNWLPGIWKSMTVLIGLAGGSLVYFLIFGGPGPVEQLAGSSAQGFFIDRAEFDPGTILSFLFCMLALSINEMGSIESIGQMLGAGDMSGRVRRGLGTQGLANLAAGAVGVIGPVSYSLSAGIIAATGCGSRYVFIPAGLGLMACAFFPGAVLIFSHLPGPVMGALMLYLMAAQLSSGLSMLVSEKCIHNFNSGITIGLPLMVGLMICFASTQVFAEVPALLRPIVANGFVMGAITVIIMEHVLLRPGRGGRL